MPDVEIMQVLVASTAHMTEEEAQHFSDGEPPASLADPFVGPYGWIIYVADEASSGIDLTELSAGMAGVIRLAWANNLRYVNFDSDGTNYEGIEEYVW